MAYKNFHDCFTNLKNGSRPGQLITVVTIVNVAAVLALIKRDASFTVKNNVYSVGISSGSAHKNLTQQ